MARRLLRGHPMIMEFIVTRLLLLVLVVPGCGSQAPASPDQRSEARPSPVTKCAGIAECEQRCATNDGSACLRAGYLYETGDGVVADAVRAFAFYEQACTANAGDGCANAGILIDQSNAKESNLKATALFVTGCERKSQRACGALGYRTLFGRGTPKDPRKGIELLTRACDANDPVSCHWLAEAYRYGDGVSKSAERELELQAKACELGFADGCENAGVMVWNGEGTKADKTRGKALFRKACDGGSKEACDRLVKLDKPRPSTPRGTATAAADVAQPAPPVCAAGLHNCGSTGFPVCVDLMTDNNRCGSCGGTCNPNDGYQCKQGACSKD